MIINAATNTPIATKRRGATSDIAVLEVTVPIKAPTKRGVNVPDKELRAPPVWINWLPLLPPPPRRFSIGFTTVLSIQTQKPQMNAPSR